MDAEDAHFPFVSLRRRPSFLILQISACYFLESLSARGLIFAQYNLKVAAVDRPERIDPRLFTEVVARNRWVNARVFSNVEDAVEWLLE
jgi:hypothetical protein